MPSAGRQTYKPLFVTATQAPVGRIYCPVRSRPSPPPARAWVRPVSRPRALTCNFLIRPKVHHRLPSGTPPFARVLFQLPRTPVLAARSRPSKGTATPCANREPPLPQDPLCRKVGPASTMRVPMGQTAVSREPMGDHPLRAGQQRTHVPALPHLGRTDHFVCAGRRNCYSWRPWPGACCYACTVLVSPVLPIGADGLAGQDHAQGWALAPIPVATRSTA